MIPFCLPPRLLLLHLRKLFRVNEQYKSYVCIGLFVATKSGGTSEHINKMAPAPEHSNNKIQNRTFRMAGVCRHVLSNIHIYQHYFSQSNCNSFFIYGWMTIPKCIAYMVCELMDYVIAYIIMNTSIFNIYTYMTMVRQCDWVLAVCGFTNRYDHFVLESNSFQWVRRYLLLKRVHR